MGTNYIKNSKRKIEKMRIYYSDDISEDVKERLDGLEDFKNTEDLENVDIFRVKTLVQVLEDKETNEDTKCLIKEILEDCKGLHFLMIIY